MTRATDIVVGSPEEPLFSLGTKMAFLATGLLALSFIVCAGITFTFVGRGVRDNLQAAVSQQGQFLAMASQALVTRASEADKRQLNRLSQQLLEEPAVLAVQVISHDHRILAHAIRPGRRPLHFFTVQLPIREDGRVVGAVRAWYSPVTALQEWTTDLRYWLIFLFCGTLILFAFILFFVNDWLLSRPFRQFVRAIDRAGRQGQFLPLPDSRRDEWGILGRRLNQYLASLIETRDKTDVLYQTARLLGAPLALQGSLEPLFSGLLHRYGLAGCALLTESTAGVWNAEFTVGLSGEFARHLSVRLGEGVAGVALASAQARLVPDLESEKQNDPLLASLWERQQVRSALFLPLRAEGQLVGLAAYFSRTAAGFPMPVSQALEQLSEPLALALHNRHRVSGLEASRDRLESEVETTLRELTRTNTRLVQKVRELKTVYDLALATAASSRVEDIIGVIIGGVKELVEVRSGAFFHYDPESGLLDPFAPAFDLPAEAASRLRCKVAGNPLLQRVLEERRPQILNFVDQAEPLPEAWKTVSIRSILALPLEQEGQVTGIFCVINKLNGLFTDDDIRLLSLLTSRVNEVLQRLALDQALHQRVHDLSVLQEIASQLPSPPVLSDTVSSIGRIMRPAIAGSDFCLFFVHHPESEALVMVGGDWDSRLTFDARAMTTGTSEKIPLADVFRENRPAQYQRGDPSELWQKDALVQAFDPQELLYLPLSVERGHLGVLVIGCGGTKTLAVDHRRLAGLLAKQVAVVIERSRLYERLRSANEKLEQINHLKNEFISMVSHELRTPLTTIKGFVSIVLNEETGPLNDQQRHFLETSDRAIDRLTLLVSDLLDISRIEAGQIKMQLRPTSLREVVGRLATNFAPQLKAQRLTLSTQFSKPLPMVMADPDRLGQVFDNLLSNALKFTTEGGITISATDKGDYVMVSVKDTGSGIVKEEQERIFEKFYQIKVGNAYPSKGTGLGLAIVRSIVESHRGKIWVESEPGQGADFRFILPRARTETKDEPVGKGEAKA